MRAPESKALLPARPRHVRAPVKAVALDAVVGNNDPDLSVLAVGSRGEQPTPELSPL
ncbi:hypothetical protein RVR_10216 [Actinacidiphila reveromycinica]|uniref:Uncharacterized protein n=1 Tax=Actinacidiphila reveromycinica TaxID=659352 RepID=A0A7U3V0P9_9ACTN|nr:hypothetical protein RVR_10216 [Streptomyces sp. SN-593]